MKSIELFAGGGGLALGLHQAGIHPELVVEWDPDSCSTLRANWHDDSGLGTDAEIRQGDIRHMDFREFEGKIDLVTGGPPCQPFSIGGKARGHRDCRDMFPEAARVVRETRPRAFIFENVRGLLRKSFAKYFEYVLLQLSHPHIGPKADEEWSDHLARLEAHHTSGKHLDPHYRILFQLLNAADYGVPQKRDRVVIVGFRSDIKEPWSFPMATHTEKALLYSKWITGTYWDEHRIPRNQRPGIPKTLEARVGRADVLPLTARWRTVRDELATLPDPRSAQAGRISNHRFQPGARAYAGHTGSPLDEPAKTLKAGDHGVPGGENMLAAPDGALRYFTTRESARLQTFPDWYHFPGSWTESMRQIGNAVPVRLASVIGESVAQALTRHECRAQTRN